MYKYIDRHKCLNQVVVFYAKQLRNLKKIDANIYS